MKRRSKATKNKDEGKIKKKIQTQKSKERHTKNTEQETEGWDKERNTHKEETFFYYDFVGENNTP